MMASTIRIAGRDLRPHKGVVSPILGSRTVLTNNPWNFVSLWLKRQKRNRAQFFWEQARYFSNAAKDLPTQSAPLLHYYAFMNAVKALLVSKSIPFAERHGVRAHNAGARRSLSLSNEGVRLEQNGILPALSSYLGEVETGRVHSLQELLFNVPFVHRTYCLTYTTQTDMFVPLINCRYEWDRATGGYFAADLSQHFANHHVFRRLPPTMMRDPLSINGRGIRSVATAAIPKASALTAAHLRSLVILHSQVRADIQYINGAETLWYVKTGVAGPARLRRFPLTLTLAAMHRLSELCRYKPIELASFLSGQKNWLLSEFIELAPGQFLDEVAAEITGHQVLVPSIRPAN